MAVVGAVCFGLVLGWITYGTLRRGRDAAGLTELTAVLAAVGGGAVTALLGLPDAFGGYAVGLAVGFAGCLVLTTLVPDSKWLGVPASRVSPAPDQALGAPERRNDP
ncbi:hypothetical protein [Nonomuraea jiangxiensis]|uniref:Uncharacterized protein n=1 Tax=Nonomuraea jiangxiensis TaxID=633440 RepID=A0A1G9RJ34_9ACTN|nr:hypothetical protein [Nonomuraea jiangxiensis]SDM23070.1 hypothetical protein SAMN05421869_138103 [Nonomuraea jiangxiensis]